LNVAEYFNPLLALVTHASTEGFIPPFHASLLMHDDNAASLLDRFARYTPPTTQMKWTEPSPER
jgi:hypothetical protein